jgi:predicted dehydrogenase
MGYTRYAVAGGQAELVAVAEPDPVRRERAAALGQNVVQFAGWEDLAAEPQLADAVIVATQDRLHTAPAVALARRGYHVLLEKPMAPTLDECHQIVEAAEASGVILAVCHVLRYTAYTRRLKELVDGGLIGDIVTVEHLEPVGWWHQAHSYVRGPWRREDESNPMLLAKSCHDLDWLSYVIGRPAVRVASFGSLYHFRKDQQPDGAADRCIDCVIEPTCAYSAPRAYEAGLRMWQAGRNPSGWPTSMITDDMSADGVAVALRDGPYGRCVYACDNDVVDHQVVALEYEGGVTASFTMSAFTPLEGRRTRIGGTLGFLEGDGSRLQHVDFRSLSQRRTDVDVAPAGGHSAAEGHGGGDQGLVDAFLTAVATNDPTPILTTARTSLASHHLAWSAEEARHSGAVVLL